MEMKITVTQRIEIDGHVEEYSASAEMVDEVYVDMGKPIDWKKVASPAHFLPLEPSVTLTPQQAARETAKELFKSLP
jgi:hypothetical protein